MLHHIIPDLKGIAAGMLLFLLFFYQRCQFPDYLVSVADDFCDVSGMTSFIDIVAACPVGNIGRYAALNRGSGTKSRRNHQHIPPVLSCCASQPPDFPVHRVRLFDRPLRITVSDLIKESSLFLVGMTENIFLFGPDIKADGVLFYSFKHKIISLRQPVIGILNTRDQYRCRFDKIKNLP